VVFLHAGVADSRMWEPQVAAFAKTFDVIRPDGRGFGKSELPPRSWSPVADLLGLMDELRLKPMHLIGCSMGAHLAIDLPWSTASESPSWCSSGRASAERNSARGTR